MIEITVEAWGGGGRGGTILPSGNNIGGGGGGGGAYSRSVLTVIPGNTYGFVVGAGASGTTAGGNSYFINATTLLAVGGNSVANNSSTGASGGNAASGVGAVRFSGGAGANGNFVSGPTNDYGGGGGSSAGTASNGATATNQNGATAPSGGGNGGSGVISTSTAGSGSPGTSPGGGGGGALKYGGGSMQTGGNGANGQIWITYIQRATPTVTQWPTASAITYGQALSASTLSGGVASVAGNFAFTDDTITPNAGTYTASVTFTPDDTDNYNTVVGSVNVTVNQAALTVTADNQSKTYGDTFTFVGNEFIANGLVGSDSLASVTLTSDGAVASAEVAGSPYAIVASNAVAGVDTNLDNYTISYVNGALIVNQATPTVTQWPTASAITYGQALSASTLSGGVASVAGNFAFTDPRLSNQHL